MSEADEALKSPKKINDRPDSTMGPMDQKENFCLVQGDNSSMSIQTKRSRKGRESNLRSSHAWNQSFFTEEGVLNPTELSCLSKTSSKSVGNSYLLDEISPLKSYHKSSVNTTKSSLCRDSKPRKLFHSSNIESEAQMIGRKTLSSKGALKNIPRSPSTNLQKRVGTTTSNVTSKVPKFTKLTSASKILDNPMLPICGSKIDKSMIKVNAGQNANLRPPAAKVDFACSSLSSNFSAAVHRKSLGKSSGANLKEGSHILPPDVHDSVTCGPIKQGAKSLPQNVNNIPRVPVASHARPSALRMPSPSLGFFCQGKASTSYHNQSQRPLQESKTQPKKLKQKSQLQLQPTSFGQQYTEAITAAIPSSPHNICVHLETKSDMKAIIIDRKTTNSTRDSSPIKSSNDSSILEEKDHLNSTPRNACSAPAKEFGNTSCSIESQIDYNMNEAEHSVTDDYLDCSSDVVLGIGNEIDLNFSKETKWSLEEEKSGNDFPNSQTYDEAAKNCILVQEMETCDPHYHSTSTNYSLSENSDFDKVDIQDPCTNCSNNSDLLNRRNLIGDDVSRKDMLLNVVPFSDEWVAALEAYGEEILVQKTGAVQNSPPDRTSPERSPWSPVKKKVQEVGPFDCTKCTKNLASS